MSTTPKFASNKKYWQILNKLVFGDEVSCPRCHAGLRENFATNICGVNYAARNTGLPATALVGYTA